MKRKILSSIILLAMLFSLICIPVNAANDITITLNGETLSFDTQPQIINDRTMVPLRAIFEALGASVDWDGSTKTVTSSKNGTTIKLTIDSNTMYVNGNPVTLDAPACIINDRTLVPVRAISEAYNANVEWDSGTKTVAISSTANTVNSNASSETEQSSAVSKYTSIGPILLNYEYGPFTVENYYSSGNYWYTNNISSFMFTKCEFTNIGKYKVTVNMQGITDYTTADVKVYFYDSDNRCIGEEWFFYKIAENVEYNVSIEKYVDKTLIDNAATIKFYSYTGKEAEITNNSVNNSSETSNDTNSTSSGNNTSTSGYKALKNALIEKGTYSGDTYSILTYYKDYQFFFAYDSESEEVSLMCTTENDSATVNILLIITKNESPQVIFKDELASGTEYIMGGYFVNSEFVVEASTLPSLDDTAINVIKTSSKLIEAVLSIKGIDVTMEELGISTD